MSEANAILKGLQREKRRAGVVAAATVMLALSWLSWAAWNWWHAGSVEALSQAAAVHATADPPQAPPTLRVRGRSPGFGWSWTNRCSESGCGSPRLDPWRWPRCPRAARSAAAAVQSYSSSACGAADGDSPAALIYDPETLKVTASTSGATLGRYTLDTLDPDAGVVVLSDSQQPGRSRHTLRLNTIGTPKTPLKIVASPKTTGGTAASERASSELAADDPRVRWLEPRECYWASIEAPPPGDCNGPAARLVLDEILERDVPEPLESLVVRYARAEGVVVACGVPG